MFLKINGPEEFKDYFVYKQCPKYTKLEIANIVEFLLEHDLNNEKGFVLFKVSPSKLYKDLKQRESTGEPLLPNASSSSIVVPINKLEQLNYLSLTEFTAKPIILPNLRPFASPSHKNQGKFSDQPSTKAEISLSTTPTTIHSPALAPANNLTLAPAQDVSKFSNQNVNTKSVNTKNRKLATASDLTLATPLDSANNSTNDLTKDSTNNSTPVAAATKSLSLASTRALPSNSPQTIAAQTTIAPAGNQESTQILPASLLVPTPLEPSNDSQLLSSLPKVTLQQALEMHWLNSTTLTPAHEYFANPAQISESTVFDPESKGFNKLPVKIQLSSIKRAYADKLKEIALLKKALAKANK